MVGNFAFLFNCTPVGRTSDSMTALLLRCLGPDALTVVRPTRLYLLDFFCSGIQFYALLDPYLYFISFLYLDLYVQGDDALTSYSGAGNVCFLRRSCTSGYKHETFRLCSSNLSCKYFLVSHRNFFPFSRWLTEISKWLPNSYDKQRGKWQKAGTCRYKHETW